MTSKQAKQQPAAAGNKEAAKPGLVDPENRDSTAFGSVLEADLRFIDGILQSLSGKQTGGKQLGGETKAAVQEALTAAAEKLAVLAQSLDEVHVDLGGVDPNSAIPSDVHEKLMAAIHRASAVATGSRENQRKQGELARHRAAINDVQKRIAKIQIQQQEQAKVAGHLQVITDRLTARQAEVAELDTNIKAGKKQIQEMEAEVSSKSEALLKRLQELKAKLDDLKQNPTAKPADVRARLSQLRARKEELSMRLEVARYEIAENNATLSIPPVRTLTPTVQPSLPVQTEMCGVCTLSKPVEDMIVLFNCMHYVCSSCMIAEVNECRKNHRNFKFALCPTCSEDVEMFDGKLISGSIKADPNGIIYPEISYM